MAHILIPAPVPSLFNYTESASNLIVDTPPDEDSHTNNQCNGNTNRLCNVFTEHSLTSNHSTDDHTTNFRKTKEMFQKLDDKSISTSNENLPYTILNRRCSNSEQHYDFPADAIEQLKKQQRDENDTTSCSSNQQTTTRIVPLLLPSNVLKRMDHLNTTFVKPIKIDRSLPKLIFQDDEKQDQWKPIDIPIIIESEYAQDGDRSSSPLFYEKPGIPHLNDYDDEDNKSNGTRRVTFSSAPIRVYTTYSPSEYDRRNDDIDPFAASAEYELEKRIEKMDVYEVVVEKGPDGLGISVLGMGVGADSGLEKLGIFVKSLNPQGVIAKDGRIQIGDQIIEVDNHSLVGVTHTYATNALKTTSGVVKFVVGREKDLEKSEILGLIQRSLQLDQEREEMSRTFQQYHDAYYERNFNDDDDTLKDDESFERKVPNEYEIEILKQCYESLEKTLDTTEKDKEKYEQLYEQAQIDFKKVEENYNQAKILIQELQNREIELRQQHTEINEQYEKKISELMKKVEELEKVVATSVLKPTNNSLPEVIEPVVSQPPDIPERKPNRSRATSGQHLVSTDRNASIGSSIRCASTSSDKVSTYSQYTTSTNHKSSDQIDQNSSMDQTNSRTLASKHQSTPSLGGVDIIKPKIYISKVPSLEQTTVNDDFSSNEYIEIKDWTADQCVQWLTAQELTYLIPIFLNRSIDGEKLLLLDSTKMKAMGIKSSKDRDQLKRKIKELKHAELNRLRERLLDQPSFHRAVQSGSRLRSSSLTKLRDRKFFGSSGGK